MEQMESPIKGIKSIFIYSPRYRFLHLTEHKQKPSRYRPFQDTPERKRQPEGLFYAIATMHSFSQKAMPYLISFFTPRRFRPSPYFRSSI